MTTNESEVAGLTGDDIKRHVHRLDTMSVEDFPLFMESLPSSSVRGEENVSLEALQALLFEGSPEEQAQNFKNQGNECYALGSKGALRDAVRYYSRGLEAGAPNEQLNATLLLNRSASQLALQNWGEALRDAQQALVSLNRVQDSHEGGSLEKLIEKAWRRILQAALVLERVTEAQQAVNVLQEKDCVIDDQQLTRLQRIRTEQELRNEQRQREDKRLALMETLVQGTGLSIVPGCEQEIFNQFAHHHQDGKGDGFDVRQLPHLQMTFQGREWPVILFYPLEAESDLVQAVQENTTLLSILEMVLDPRSSPSPPWDPEGQRYGRIRDLNIFVVRGDQLYRLSPKLKLKDLFGRVITTVDYGILAFHVCPKGEETSFINRFINITDVC